MLGSTTSTNTHPTNHPTSKQNVIYENNDRKTGEQFNERNNKLTKKITITNKPTTTISSKPSPTMCNKPLPTSPNKPTPATYNKPLPTSPNKPTPANYNKPTPANYNKPLPTSPDKPTPANYNKPLLSVSTPDNSIVAEGVESVNTTRPGGTVHITAALHIGRQQNQQNKQSPVLSNQNTNIVGAGKIIKPIKNNVYQSKTIQSSHCTSVEIERKKTIQSSHCTSVEIERKKLLALQKRQQQIQKRQQIEMMQKR